MVRLIVPLLLLALSPLRAADSALRFASTLGGTGVDSGSVTVDPSGFVILTGSTSSYDFPVTNGSLNRATHFAVSPDGGLTWQPLANLPSGTPISVAVDSSTPPVWYAGGTTGVFKSTDSGATWTPTGPLGIPACDFVAPFCGVNALAISPAQPATIYAATPAGILKTTDAGATWRATAPLPNQTPQAVFNSIDYLAIDPLHADHIFTSSISIDFRSFDGGQTWTRYTPPALHPGDFYSSRLSVAFDPFTPDVIYLAKHGDLFRSADGGVTWTVLPTPFQGASSVVAGPSKRGLLYVLSDGQDGSLFVTADGGVAWRALLPYQPQKPPPQFLAIDPSQPAILATDSLRSQDGGATWTPLAIGRATSAIVADPKTPGRIVAATSGSTSAFLTKLDSNGQIVFSTYFGGQGATTCQRAATDPNGNIYLTGATNSPDFPVTPGAFRTTPPAGGTAPFAAKFHPDGNLVYATFLDGAGAQPSAIAVDPSGSAVVTGTFNGAAAPHTPSCFVTRLAPDGGAAIFDTRLGGSTGDYCSAAAADSAGNTVVVGVTYSRDFPVTGSGAQSSLHGYTDAIVARFDPAGKLVYAGYLGGGDMDSAAAVTLDATGNIYVTGTTASKDFPTTTGAYQTSLRANCAYPSSTVVTGIIGTITYYQMDDAFVTRLDPAGNVIFSTYLGGDCYDRASGIAVDPPGNVWVSGSTNSSTFPQAEPFHSGPGYGFYKSFVTELEPGGGSLKLSSYLDAGTSPSIAVDVFGNAYLAGTTVSQVSSNGGLPAPPRVSASTHVLLAKVQTQFINPVSIRTVGNAFSVRSGPVSPGQITLIAADGVTPPDSVDLTFNLSSSLPFILAATQVLFDGEAAPLVSVAAGRVVAIAPNSLAGKASTSVQVIYQGAASPPVLADVLADLGFLSLDGSGTGQAYARNADGTLNSPQNPAPQGSILTFYLTGFGAVDPSCPPGTIATAASPQPDVAFGKVTAVPGSLCGLFQLALRVSTYGPTPNQPLGVYLSPLTYAAK